MFALPEAKTPWIDVNCSSIFAADLQREYRTSRPLGFCVDIGAPMSVIGKSELKRLIVAVKKQKRQVRRRPSRFIFGDRAFESLG